MGTKSFITAEAERLRKELEEQELVVNQYKATNRFELPEQLDSNLRSLEQLRRTLESSSQRLAALQERKGILQKQVVESDILGVDLNFLTEHFHTLFENRPLVPTGENIKFLNDLFELGAAEDLLDN